MLVFEGQGYAAAFRNILGSATILFSVLPWKVDIPTIVFLSL